GRRRQQTLARQDDDAGVRAAAHRVRERDARAGHLARPRRAAELPGELDDLGEGRGAQRLALGEQAARGVDRQPRGHLAAPVAHPTGEGRTSSTESPLRYMACGFATPWRWFVADTRARSSSRTSLSSIRRWARSAKYAGVAASPASSRHGSKKLERIMPRGIFSSPKTSTQSWRPLATAAAPRPSAAPPLAQPASTFTIGTPASPSAV